AAIRRWPCPPLNYVYADRAGAIGYHAAGLVPRRVRPGYGICDANDPDDVWDGVVLFDDLPNVANLFRGWVATANNVPRARAPWYHEPGAGSDGSRARRIRERLTAKDHLSPEEVAAVHGDHISARGRDLAPALVRIVAPGQTPREQQAIRALRRWRGEQTLGSVGASGWSAVLGEWTLALARARLPGPLVDLAATPGTC